MREKNGTKFLGSPGLDSNAGPSTAKVGGNTTCVSLRLIDYIFVFDAGTGIRGLGKYLEDKDRAFWKGKLMNSTKDDNNSQAQPKRNESPPSLIEDFFKQLRNDGISALAHLDKDEQAQVVNWAQDIVNQYGSILKENPMNIKNLVDLPCLKEDLKMAIKVLLPAYIAKGSNDVVDLLKDRYVRLSTFQKISQEDQDTIIKEANRIDQKIESAETTLFPTYHKYMEIIISEQKILLDEVNSFIDNMQIQKKEETDH